MGLIGKSVRFYLLLATLTLVVGFSVLTTPALADRPGTPNNFTIFNCFHSPAEKPYICGSFTNTAREDVTFEMEWVREGKPVGIRPSACIDDGQTSFGCYTVGKRYKWGETHVDSTGRDIPLRFTAKELEFNTTYCARLRARRTSDDMVSQIWTNAPCIKTPGPPGPPAPPEFTITFDGRQPAQSGPAIASTLRVGYVKADGAGLLELFIVEANGPDSKKPQGLVNFDRREFKPWIALNRGLAHEYPIDARAPWLYVEVCSTNIAGKTCAHKVASASAETVITPPPPGQKPVRATGSSRDKALQQDINLPGMDYRKQELNGNDPLQCQQLCNAEAPCKAWTFVKGGIQSAHAMCWLKNDIPRSAYDKNMVSGIKPGAKSAEQSGPPMQYKIELPGSEYRQVATSLFWECNGLCSQDSQCKAWTWYSPGVKGPKAMCSLKNAAPAGVANDKAVSRVKDGAPPAAALPNSASQTQVVAAPPPAAQPAAAPPAQPAANASGLQAGIDMPGQDYRNAALDEGANAPAVCQSLCAQDAKCRAWTWVKAGIQGPKVMCWLKNAVPPSVSNPNTVSGLKPARSSLR